MKKITNNLLEKELKKYNYFLIITIILFLTGASFIGIYFFKNFKIHENSIYLNTVIENMDNKTGITAHLKVAQEPYSFAKYSDDPYNAYYIIFDGEYYYITYMSDNEYNKLNKKDIKEKPITIYGKTTYTPEDVRDLALETYNEGLDEEDQIDKDDFNNYFGGVYLDITSINNSYNWLITISITLIIFSIISLIISFIIRFKSQKILNEIEDNELKKIEKELNEYEAIYYKKCHLILSKNHLITFIDGLKIYNYKDIIWIYENKIKQKGFTIIRTISVLNKNGKTIDIAQIPGMNTKNEKIISEILTNISKKNKNILIGYTTENKKKAKEITK